jgi:uncharacterized protein
MFCILFCFAPLAAWPQAPQSAPAAEAAPNRGALFKVERDGHTLFLFGTIHVGAPDFYPLEPRLMAALAQASVLALEVDLGADAIELRSAMREFGLYPDGGTAMAAIAPAFRPRLKRLLRHYGIDPQAVAPMKPWLLASMLAVSEFAAQGYQTSLAVDAYLTRQARERNIPVRELETVAGQMALFGRLPLADQVRFLEESITTIEDRTQARQAREVAQAWSRADAAGLDKVAREAAADHSFSGRFVQTVLLDGRNPALADGIERQLGREAHSMAAIGVLHLLGTGSVPALLRARGLKVERVY